MQSICQQEVGFCPFGPCSPRLSDSDLEAAVKLETPVSWLAKQILIVLILIPELRDTDAFVIKAIKVNHILIQAVKISMNVKIPTVTCARGSICRSFGDGRLSLEQYVFSTTYSGKPCRTDEQQNNSYMKMMTNVVGGGGAA
ncbi:unnamed protein product [Lactuca saligna]|uniref:Uncharacterized protein n=1 Tax=Lactuca saligna TaxID=75948 RepID=A0AA35ZM37_LACSI|nr:unnamed protein product [Lactuca saligna]